MSVNMVTGGSNEVLFKSGCSVGPSSFIGFDTTWELIWVPLREKGMFVSVEILTVGSIEVVLRTSPSSLVGF